MLQGRFSNPYPHSTDSHVALTQPNHYQCSTNDDSHINARVRKVNKRRTGRQRGQGKTEEFERAPDMLYQCRTKKRRTNEHESHSRALWRPFSSTPPTELTGRSDGRECPLFPDTLFPIEILSYHSFSLFRTLSSIINIYIHLLLAITCRFTFRSFHFDCVSQHLSPSFNFAR